MRIVIITFLTFLCFQASYGQDTEQGNWMMYFGKFSISERLAIHGEIQYRNYNAIGDLEQLLNRAGLQYKFKNHPSRATLGYGYILSEPYVGEEEKTQIHEHRIYQEYLTKQSWGERVHASHRYRFEQRFIDNADDMKLRFRYSLGLSIPINNKELVKNTFYLAAYNELFIHGQDQLFDRNRIYGGLGYAILDNFKTRLGYMSQVYQNGNRGQVNISVHHNF